MRWSLWPHCYVSVPRQLAKWHLFHHYFLSSFPNSTMPRVAPVVSICRFLPAPESPVPTRVMPKLLWGGAPASWHRTAALQPSGRGHVYPAAWVLLTHIGEITVFKKSKILFRIWEFSTFFKKPLLRFSHLSMFFFPLGPGGNWRPLSCPRWFYCPSTWCWFLEATRVLSGSLVTMETEHSGPE